MEVYVYSSHGVICADSVTGRPLRWELNSEDRTALQHLLAIHRFDFEEWRRTYPGEDMCSLDILDVGYYSRVNGEEVYTEAEPEARADIKADMDEASAKKREELPR